MNLNYNWYSTTTRVVLEYTRVFGSTTRLVCYSTSNTRDRLLLEFLVLDTPLLTLLLFTRVFRFTVADLGPWLGPRFSRQAILDLLSRRAVLNLHTFYACHFSIKLIFKARDFEVKRFSKCAIFNLDTRAKIWSFITYTQVTSPTYKKDTGRNSYVKNSGNGSRLWFFIDH